MEKNRPKANFTLPHLRAIPVAIGYILTSLEVKVVYCPLEKSPKDVRTPKGPIPSTVEERKEVIYSISMCWITQAHVHWTDWLVPQAVNH